MKFKNSIQDLRHKIKILQLSLICFTVVFVVHIIINIIQWQIQGSFNSNLIEFAKETIKIEQALLDLYLRGKQ